MNKPTFVVYLLTNQVNGKVYVGITNCYEKRMREHSYAYHETSGVLARAIRKHGWHSFTSTILEHIPDHASAIQREVSVIAQYDSTDPTKGYNLTQGGEGTVGYSPSPESREKMRQRKVGQTLRPDRIAKLVAANTGRVVSEETRRKISEAQKGKPRKGFTPTPEHRAKLSAAKKGKPFSDEHRAKLSEAARNRKLTKKKTFSPEARLKMSLAAKARHAQRRS